MLVIYISGNESKISIEEFMSFSFLYNGITSCEPLGRRDLIFIEEKCSTTKSKRPKLN